MKKSWYAVRNTAGATATIGIYEDIGEGGTNALDFRQTLNRLEAQGVKNIMLEIASNGGDVTAGFAVIDMLNRFPGRVDTHISGIAASMASAIAMVGKTITISEGSFIMIHEPWGSATGSPEQIASFATALDAMRENLVSLYAKRTNTNPATIAAMMAKETWMDARRAIELGFADKISGGALKAAARARASRIAARFEAAPKLDSGETLREAAFRRFNNGGRNVSRKT